MIDVISTDSDQKTLNIATKVFKTVSGHVETTFEYLLPNNADICALRAKTFRMICCTQHFVRKLCSDQNKKIFFFSFLRNDFMSENYRRTKPTTKLPQ